MVELLSKTIKSKKDNKEYTLYYLKSGDFETHKFFPTGLSISEFHMLWEMCSHDSNK